MTKYEETLQRIDDSSIHLFEDNSIDNLVATAFSIKTDKGKGIVYSSRDRLVETRCILEHELTHFEKDLFYKLDDPAYIKRKIESKCDYITTKRLVPLSVLQECINKKMEDYEICESLEITQDILNAAKSIYEAKLYANLQRS